jgi:D-arabinose 1-dehydrogenase-like Zn-dependent alcohol dehydrogenase
MGTYSVSLSLLIIHQNGTRIRSFQGLQKQRHHALFVLPEALKSEHAAPLICGGTTLWSALSVYNVRPTDRVRVIAVGRLGHLTIQFASKKGCERP